jgi:hypothetical protein
MFDSPQVGELDSMSATTSDASISRTVSAPSFFLRISANVTDDFGNVTGLGPVLGCADLIVEMGSV